MSMAQDNQFATASLVMDRSQYPIGNSNGDDNRGRLHVKVANNASEAVPVFLTNAVTSSTDVNQFNQIASVPQGAETLIDSLTVPAGFSLNLIRIDVSGENIGTYNVYLNGVIFARKRTWFSGTFSETFNFAENNNGYKLVAGDKIEIKILHLRPTTATFESRIQGVQQGV